MSQLRVLIVGASIAGPTAAYWFARAGARVTVIERFPELRTNGQNIDIRTAGVTVMRKMPGMEPAVRAKIVPIDGFCIVRGDGRPYGTIRATGNPDQQSLLSEYEIFRGDLAQIIIDLTKDNENVKYIFGEQVASMQQDEEVDGPIKVEFANGLPSAEYDLVVACDGATSRTRAIGFGCGVRDHIKPVNAWAAYFTIEEDLLKGSQMGYSYCAPGGRFMALGPDPSGVNRSVLMGILPRNDSNATLSFREAANQGTDALKKHVASFYRGCGWRSEEILEGLMESRDFYASEMVQVKPPSIYKGRFALVGDAGYAAGPTGGGTSLALAGGYLLAGEICKHKGDLKAGLQGYEDRMRPIITDLQKIPPGIPALIAPQSAWALWLRNNIFAIIAWTGLLEVMSRFFASSFGSDKYGIPDYDWPA